MDIAIVNTLRIKILNFILFEIGWFVIAIYHNNLCAVIVAALALVNFYLGNNKFFTTAYAGVVAASIGISNDFIIFNLEIIKFPGYSIPNFPLWLISLWLLFASTLHCSLAWLMKLKLPALAILGGIGGAASYLAAEKIGVLQYNFYLLPAYMFHFINWVILLPLIIIIFKKAAA